MDAEQSMAFQAAARLLRKAANTDAPFVDSSYMRGDGSWVLCSFAGERLATVSPLGQVELHAGIVVAVEEVPAVVARVLVTTSWACPKCATVWRKAGMHLGAVKVCRCCGQPVQLQRATG